MSSTPLITVLLPTYNAERYLPAAIDSILAQTERDFELLIADDASTDGSDALLADYQRRDSRVRVVKRPKSGYAVNLNVLIEQARGTYFARMDADDVALPHRFEKQLARMNADPSLVAVGGALWIIDPQGRRIMAYAPPTDDATLQAQFLAGHCPINHPSAMLRAEAVRRVGGYDPSLVPTEDIDLFLKLGEIGTLGNVGEPVQCYRYHPSSESHTKAATRAAHIRTACAAARRRRGLPPEEVNPPAWPPVGVDPHRRALGYGWWAFNHGSRSTALVYAARAIRARPTSAQGYKLLACAALKPTGNAGFPAAPGPVTAG